MSSGYIGRGPLGSIEEIFRDVLLTTPIKYKGYWTPNTIYNENDLIQNDSGAAYIVSTTHTSGTDFNDNLDKVTLLAGSITIGGVYDNAETYLDGQIIEYQGGLYLAETTTTGNLPTDTNFWKLITSDLGRQPADSVNITGGDITVDNFGTTNVTSSLIPDTDVTYDLGSATFKWNDLYLAGNSIFLGDATISSDGTSVTITTADGNNFVLTGDGIASSAEIQFVTNQITTTTADTDLRVSTVGTGEIDLEATTNITGDLTVSSGNITSASSTSNLMTTTDDVNIGSNTQTVPGTFDGTTTIRNNLTIDGLTTVKSHVLPDVTETYDLGSPTNRFNTLYLSGATIDLGDGQISFNQGNFQFVGGFGDQTEITTDKATFNLVDDTATTINFGGAATNVQIGSAAGTTFINNSLDVAGDLDVTGATTLSTASVTDLTNGRIVLAGASGELQDDANFTFDGTTFSVTGGTVLTGQVQIVSTTALTVPVGSELDKSNFSAETGQIRFNTASGSFEGYQGTVWSSLGGVKSVDGLTYISAELNPGDSDDTLRFYTDNTLQMLLTTSALDIESTVTSVNVKSTTGSTSSSTGALIVSGGVGIGENLYVGGELNITGNTSLGADLVVTGDLTVNGTTTTVNSTAVSVDDINIILGDTASPSNVTADGGGITLKGTTDKTLAWSTTTTSWTSSENFDLANSKTYKIAGVDVLTASALLGSATNATVAGAADTLVVGADNSGTLSLRNATVDIENNATIGGTLDVTGNFAVNTDKFTVDAATGNTVVAGTLTVNGTTVYDGENSVTGLFTAEGGLLVEGDGTGTQFLTVNDGTTTVFQVDSSNGNTTVEGTLDVTGAVTLGSLETTTGSFSGQITSTVSTGTAPLVIASTTLVDNLNADQVDGFDAGTANTASTIVVRDANNNINLTSLTVSGSSSGTTIVQAENNASGTLTLPSVTDTLVGKTTTDSFSNKTINLANNTLTGTIAQFNTALSDADFATIAGTETLSNKTFNLTDNTLTGTTAQFNTALSDGDFATLAGTEDLTNKTITNPTINAGTGVIVLPNTAVPGQTSNGSVVWDNDNFLLTIGTGSGRKTLVDLDSTQTLTNKTLTSPTITGVSPTITLGGDLSGSVTLTDLGSGTLSATIQPNSVALGTDTTGNYIATITGTANQISVTGSGSETAAVTLALPQDIALTSSPTFGSATLNQIQVGITAVNEIDTTAGNLVLDSAGGTVEIDDNLTVAGDLTVNGTTTYVNSTVTEILDPIMTLGGEADGGAASTDDNKDRGIAFKWNDGIESLNGFFGFDDSTGYFTFVPDATITGEVISGTAGDMQATNFRGNLISDTATIASGLTALGDVQITPATGKTLEITPVDTGTMDNVDIGSTTRGSGAFTTLTSNGATTFTAGTSSTDSTTGTVVVTGGVGISENLNVGTNADITGTLTVDGDVTFNTTLTVPNGGTGITTATANGIVYGNGTSAFGVTAAAGTSDASTSNEILTVDGSGVPVWTDVIDGGTF